MGDGPSAASETVCGMTVPAAAAPSIRIEGEVTAVGSAGPPPNGMLVEAWQRGGAQPVATTTTTGAFAMNALTGGAPLDGFLRASAPSFVDTYFHPGVPLSQNTDVGSFGLVDPALFAMFSGGAPPSTTASVAMILMRDCMPDTSVTGATVIVSPPGNAVIRYFDLQGTFKPAPDATTFGAVVTELAPGPLTITTSNVARPMRTTAVTTYAGSLTVVQMLPQ